MGVDFSNSFEKFSGKMLDSVSNSVKEVINTGSIEVLTDYMKLVDFEFIYRLRIDGYRAFFSYHVKIVDDFVMFLYLMPEGLVYDKNKEKNLQRKDI